MADPAGNTGENATYIQDPETRRVTYVEGNGEIISKTYDLCAATGAHALILMVSEDGRLSTFTTAKLQPVVTSEEGEKLIMSCLNAPPPTDASSAGGDANP